MTPINGTHKRVLQQSSANMVFLQCFWFVPTGNLWRVDYQRLEDQPASAIPNGIPEVTAQDGERSHPCPFTSQRTWCPCMDSMLVHIADKSDMQQC